MCLRAFLRPTPDETCRQKTKAAAEVQQTGQHERAGARQEDLRQRRAHAEEGGSAESAQRASAYVGSLARAHSIGPAPGHLRRSPASVTVTSRRTAALEDTLAAAA